mmetsp:Transcript_9725/g.32542  ORF Transcript_9725/g.32542 Transcript_9725/m.32542 type:complete len:295 (-) Transcript_9725:301-1185(-)
MLTDTRAFALLAETLLPAVLAYPRAFAVFASPPLPVVHADAGALAVLAPAPPPLMLADPCSFTILAQASMPVMFTDARALAFLTEPTLAVVFTYTRPSTVSAESLLSVMFTHLWPTAFLALAELPIVLAHPGSFAPHLLKVCSRLLQVLLSRIFDHPSFLLPDWLLLAFFVQLLLLHCLVSLSLACFPCLRLLSRSVSVVNSRWLLPPRILLRLPLCLLLLRKHIDSLLPFLSSLLLTQEVLTLFRLLLLLLLLYCPRSRVVLSVSPLACTELPACSSAPCRLLSPTLVAPQAP